MNRPFDLKAALSGEPVYSKENKSTGEVILSSLTPEGGVTHFHVTGSPYGYRLDGVAYGASVGCVCDTLVMAPRKVKKTVWVNLLRNGASAVNRDGAAYWHDTKQQAESLATFKAGSYLAVACPVEIEVSE